MCCPVAPWSYSATVHSEYFVKDLKSARLPSFEQLNVIPLFTPAFCDSSIHASCINAAAGHCTWDPHHHNLPALEARGGRPSLTPFP